MTSEALLIWVPSVGILLALLIYEFIQHRRSSHRAEREPAQKSSVGAVTLLVLIAVVAIIAIAAFYASSSAIEPKAVPQPTPWGMIAMMFVAMLVGIVAQSRYFDEGTAAAASTWLKPVLASPIVFIPLVSSYQSSLMNMTSFNLPELMILLVSFQNGFFWKVIFDKQAELLSKSHAETRAS